MTTQAVHIVGMQFSTFVRSVQLCCEEKGIPYTIGAEVNGQPIKPGSPELFALHPFGKIPVLLHGDRQLIETPSICRYLDSAFSGPALQPEEPWLRAQVDQWTALLALYIDQVIVRSYLLEFVFPKGNDGSVRQEVVDAARPELTRILKLLDDQLAEGVYLAGDTFTIADAIAAPMLDYLSGLPAAEGFLIDLPRLVAYVDRLRKRPSAARVLVAPTFR